MKSKLKSDFVSLRNPPKAKIITIIMQYFKREIAVSKHFKRDIAELITVKFQKVRK